MHAELDNSLQHRGLAPNMMSMQRNSYALRERAYRHADRHADASAVRGEAQCASQSELQCLSAQTLQVQENERHRIAKDLHDGLGQSLTMISLGLSECVTLLANAESGKAEQSLQKIRSKVRDAFAELRRVVMDLRPSMLDDLGILATLSWFFREFENAGTGIRIEKHLPVQERSIPVRLKVPIYRILQEAISNIVKHAQADHIRVSLVKAGDQLHLSIEDNGQGFDPTVRDNYCFVRKGLGLLSMKDRANISGGVCRIDSAVGQGTRIHVSWPCR